MSKKILIGILCSMLIICVGACTPILTITSNTWDFINQKIDDSTRYESLKKVEDTCRSMIASYESDKLMYEQYKGSDNQEKQSWAEQAKIRANKTAAIYNNYVLKNSFLWKDNIPKDILGELEYIS